VVCFLCKKREQRHGSFHRPLNAQLLQQGKLEDVSQACLMAARLCDACHQKDVASSAGECSSDAALEAIIQQQSGLASNSLDSSSDADVVAYAKAATTANVARKLRNNEAVLLAEAFSDLNSIPLQHGQKTSHQGHLPPKLPRDGPRRSSKHCVRQRRTVVWLPTGASWVQSAPRTLLCLS